MPAARLTPTTVFNTVTSFMTNTNLQHYSGDQHLSYFSQIVFIIFNMFASAAIGLCCLAAVIRALRSDANMGNFYLDMWRVLMYAFLPASLLMGVILMARGQPMTMQPMAQVATLEPGAMGTGDDGKPLPKCSRAARSPPSFRSSTSAPMAAASSERTPRIRSKTQTPRPTFSKA